MEWQKQALYKDFLTSLEDAAVGLAPLCPETPFSRGKSFGKVLAYLDRGVPVVGSDACEHGAFFDTDSGVITNNEAAWVTAIARLLEDAPRRAALAGCARSAFGRRLTAGAAAARLDRALRCGVVDTRQGARVAGG